MPSRSEILVITLAGGSLLAVALWPSRSAATPALARREQMACGTCHTAFPQLNPTGRAFLENGYRFAAPTGVTPTGAELGSGMSIEALPGLSVRLVSDPLVIEDGMPAVVPLDAIALIAVGSSGTHWSYMAHIEAQADEGLVPMVMGTAQYRFGKGATAFAGFAPLLARDGYDTLNPERRLDHAAHGALDYNGSAGLALSDEAGIVGAFGRAGSLFWLAELAPSVMEMDAMGEEGPPPAALVRVAVDAGPGLSFGALASGIGGPDDAALRGGLDADLNLGAHALQAVVLVDLHDDAILGEVGWNLVAPAGPVWLIPLARVDLVSAGGRSPSIAPTAGLGVMRSTGRLSVELTTPVDTAAGDVALGGEVIAEVVF
jgi:hypothetical protein